MIIFFFVKNLKAVIRFFLCYIIHEMKKSEVFTILSSSVVERSTVNRLVVGSSPTWGDIKLRYIYFIYGIE